MGDRPQPRVHIAALYWVVYAADLCSKRCDRLLDRLALARRVERRQRGGTLETSLPGERSLT